MAFLPNSGSVLAFQGTVPWSVIGATNQSISGTVNVGNIPTIQNISGSVVATQGTTPWIVNSIGSIISVQQGSIAVVIVGGSIAANFTPPVNQSVSGTVQAQIQGSVATVIIGGSIAASFTPAANQSVSGTVGASIIGLPPVNVTNTVTVTGAKTNNNAAPGANNIGALTGVATAVQPSYTEGDLVALSQDLVGGLRVINTELSDNTGTFTNATQTTSVTTGTVDGYGTALVSINGTYGTATAVFEISDDDGTTWYSVQGSRTGDGIIESGYTSLTNISRVWIIPINGADKVRVRSTAVASGTVNVRITISSGITSEAANVTIGSPLPTGTNTIGSVTALQGSSPWAVAGSIAAFQAGLHITSVSGQVTVVSSLTGGIFPISGSVSAVVTNSVNVNGSVVATQGTSPWIVNFQNSSILATPVGSTITVFQNPSIVGTYAEDAPSASGDKGFLVMGARNDTLASVTSNDGDYSSHVVGPAGELISVNAPFTKWVFNSCSVFTTTSQVALPAQGASIFTYVTAIQVSNLSANQVLVTFGTGSNSILGYTTAPANGGSNIVMPNGWKTTQNAPVTASISGGIASVFISIEGFVAKV